MRHLLLGLLLLFVTGCTQTAAPTVKAPTHPDLVLVTIDGLPAERLTLYGGKEAAPTLERLAREGVVFDRVYSQANAPLYGEASLITSRYATELDPLIPEVFALRKDQLTLPKILGMYGYTCAGFHGDAALDEKRGFAVGYAAYSGDAHCGALAHVATAARAWMQANAGKAPLFVSVQSCLPAADARRDAAALHGASDLQAADTALAQLLEGIDASRTVVVVTAACGDPAADGPQGALHVPLVVWGSGVEARRRGTRSATLVESLDLLPTLLVQGGVVVPAQIRGRDFSAAFGTAAPAGEERHTAFAEATTWAGAIHDGKYGLFATGAPAGSPAMLARLAHPGDAGFDFYDLTAHPPRKMPPSQADAGLVADLGKQLLAVEQNSIAVRQDYRKGIDPKLADQLRKHGYWDAGK